MTDQHASLSPANAARDCADHVLAQGTAEALTPPKEASSQPKSVDRTLEDELMDVLARQARRVPIPVFLSSLLIALMVWLPQPRLAPVAWLAAVAAILALRRAVIGRLPTLTRLTVAERLRLAVALSAVNGAVQGLSLVFAPSLDTLERAAQALVLLGLCAGSVATTVGHRKMILAFVAPTVLPLAAVWAFGPAAPDRRWIVISIAVLTLLFGALLLALAKDVWRLFSESFEIRLQQTALNGQLNAALGEAHAANRAKTRFLASASHDLRQPLHTLSLFGAALLTRPLEPPTREIAVQIGAALKALDTQLEALLDISKLDAGIVPVRPTMISLQTFLRQREAEVRPLAEAKGLALTVRCAAEAVCETDEALFARLVRNLMDNAIKYTERGSIVVQVHAKDAFWVVCIRDTGIGIPAEEQERVFDEFYQLHNPERDRARGLGLGLSIVRRFSRLLQVGLEMESKPGHGTEIRLSIPRAQQSRPLPAGPAAAPPAIPRGLSVLVIDDEEAIRNGMAVVLRAEGCTVSLASTTEEALALAADSPVNIVVADLRLRGDDDGISAIARLRAMHAGMPAVLVSGDTDPARLLQAREAGIPHLYKPILDVSKLMEAIAQAIQQGEHHDVAEVAVEPRVRY